MPVWPDYTVRSMRSKTIIDCELWKDVLVRSFIVNGIQGELTLIKFLAQLIKKILNFHFFYEIITFFNGTASQTCLINLCWKRRKNKNVNFWKNSKKKYSWPCGFFKLMQINFPNFWIACLLIYNLFKDKSLVGLKFRRKCKENKLILFRCVNNPTTRKWTKWKVNWN